MDPTAKQFKLKKLTVTGINAGRTANVEVRFPITGNSSVIVTGCGVLVKKCSEGEAECQNQLICGLEIRKPKEFTPDILHFL